MSSFKPRTDRNRHWHALVCEHKLWCMYKQPILSSIFLQLCQRIARSVADETQELFFFQFSVHKEHCAKRNSVTPMFLRQQYSETSRHLRKLEGLPIYSRFFSHEKKTQPIGEHKSRSVAQSNPSVRFIVKVSNLKQIYKRSTLLHIRIDNF